MNLLPKSASTSSRLVLGFGAVTGLSLYFLYPDPSRSAPILSRALLSPSHFTPSTVISNETCGPDTKLLHVAIPPNLIPPRDPSGSFSSIWSVYIKDDDIQVERPYTPLEGIDDQGRMLFWIKKYSKGEVGRWLHSKSSNDKIELRGPLTTWPWKENTWDEVIMISGGTGITPFYQLFHSVISRSTENKTRFTLLHSSRSTDDLPPSRILDSLIAYSAQRPENFQMSLFVDSSDGSSPPHLPKVQIGRIGKTTIEQCLGLKNNRESWWRRIFGEHAWELPDKKILFLVCGPEPMINAISGPYDRNFSQGAVGGVLGEMGFNSNQVYKL